MASAVMADSIDFNGGEGVDDEIDDEVDDDDVDDSEEDSDDDRDSAAVGGGFTRQLPGVGEGAN
jgi:hypothetical protein